MMIVDWNVFLTMLTLERKRKSSTGHRKQFADLIFAFTARGESLNSTAPEFCGPGKQHDFMLMESAVGCVGALCFVEFFLGSLNNGSKATQAVLARFPQSLIFGLRGSTQILELSKSHRSTLNATKAKPEGY